MQKTRFALVPIVLVIAASTAVAFAQMQVNPQVNTGIYAGSGPTSVRYAGQYQGPDTVFNVASKTADTRGGFANTGVYGSTGVLTRSDTAYQNMREIPPGMVSGYRPNAAPMPGGSPYQANAGVGAPVNAQVNGAINAAVQ